MHGCSLQAVVLEHGLVLHIGPPRLRLLPVELLLEPKRLPQVKSLCIRVKHAFANLIFKLCQVFRPQLSAEERDAFIKSLLSLLGKQYSSFRVYKFIARLGLDKRFGMRLATLSSARTP